MRGKATHTILLLCVLFLTLTAQAQYGGGTGEPNDPYLIYTPEQMNEIGLHEDDWDKHFKLMSDISLAAYEGTDFNIIGKQAISSRSGIIKHGRDFTGNFDGNGHIISNFTYDCNNLDKVSIFRYVTDTNAEIRNLGLIDPNVHAEAGNCVGTLVGLLGNGGTVTNCYVDNGNIEGNGTVGGLVGLNCGVISHCHFSGCVSGSYSTGGLVGTNNEGAISNCSARTVVTGDFQLGGLAGNNVIGEFGGKIVNCHSSGKVQGGELIGGLVGVNECRSASPSAIENCYSTSNVSGNSAVGGLVGANIIPVAPIGIPQPRPGYTYSTSASEDLSVSIRGCYAIGSVMGDQRVGGLVGENDACIDTSYSFSTVHGVNAVGGLVGSNWGNIQACYSIGLVTGNENVGGLVGENYENISITSSFWDMETSGQTTSSGGEGKTTSEMQTDTTFLEAGWDFVDETVNGTDDIWWILEKQSYPRLWWQYGWAFSPYPLDGSVNVPQPLTLSWLPGGSDSYHDIYFGENKEAVVNATIESPEIYRGRLIPDITSYDPDTLKLDKTYYWRIDEVNEADPNSPWKGDVWCFTTAHFIVVDDFESYDGVNQVWFSWHDGLGYGAPSNMGYYPGNGTGSAVGNETGVGPIMEMNIVHSGRQSMPYSFNNNKKGYLNYSEAEKKLSYPRDWTEDGVTELSLWFRGYPAASTFVEEPVGIYIMTGLGADIGANKDYETDEFHFAYKELTGTGSIVAKVESIENSHEWAKAGVMIRATLDEYSKYAFAYVTPGNGIAFQGRRDYGGSSFVTNKTGFTASHWVKLERDITGNFTAYDSSNGFAWEAIGEIHNIQMYPNVYVGLALTSHDSSVSCEAQFSYVTITGSVGPEWANQDIGIVTNDLEPMYVAIANNTGKPAIVYHDNPGAAGIDAWIEWIMPLAFADQGIDLTNVNSIAIGFGDRNNPQPGGQGKMYFDDIRLYRPRPAESNDL